MSGYDPSSRRAVSPKRKRSEYEADHAPAINNYASSTLTQRPGPHGESHGGDAYDFSSPAASDSDPETPATPPPAAPAGPPPRPTSLPFSPTHTLRGHARAVSAVAFSPTGTHLASSSADATLQIWDLTTLPDPTCTATLEGHLAGISCLGWNRDGSVLASGSDDKSIRLWDTGTSSLLRPQHNSSGGGNNNGSGTGAAGGGRATALQGHSNYVSCLAFSPKGNMLVSGSYDEAVFLWDVRTGSVMRQLPAHSDPVTGVDFVRDGTLVVSCSSDGLIRIWDAGSGQCLRTLVHEDNASVGGVRFSPNGRFVLAATLDGCVRLWDYVEGKVVKTYAGHRNGQFAMQARFGTYRAEQRREKKPGIVRETAEVDMEGGGGELVQAGDEDVVEQGQVWAFVACGDEDGKLVVWDVNTKEILHTGQGHEGVVLGIDVNPRDSRRLVTCGADGTVKLWALDSSNSTNGHA